MTKLEFMKNCLRNSHCPACGSAVATTSDEAIYLLSDEHVFAVRYRYIGEVGVDDDDQLCAGMNCFNSWVETVSSFAHNADVAFDEQTEEAAQ